MKLLLCILALMHSVAFATILPPNNLDQEDNLYGFTGLSQAEFNAVIERAEKIYAPIIASHGAKLKVNRLWTNPTVNANASQNGSTWEVNMYGGLARRPEITVDGFASVLCHEIGHHLGGAAFYGQTDWAAAEGQADYYATQVCSKLIWKSDIAGQRRAEGDVDAIPKAKCDSVWSGQNDRLMCYRTAMAGKSLAILLGALEGSVPDFSKKDSSVVRVTDTAHPAAQCRLDTYLAGALCLKAFDKMIIPGRGENQLSVAAEKEAFKYSCSEVSVGARPKCWYKQLSPVFRGIASY